jgi:hypothetical protein
MEDQFMARYQDALEWIIVEDDTEFLWEHDNPVDVTLSVTASMVAGLWNKTAEQVVVDLRKCEEQLERRSARSK